MSKATERIDTKIASAKNEIASKKVHVQELRTKIECILAENRMLESFVDELTDLKTKQ
jgi:hypothetical protein